jgi:hypothetical protein
VALLTGGGLYWLLREHPPESMQELALAGVASVLTFASLWFIFVYRADPDLKRGA